MSKSVSPFPACEGGRKPNRLIIGSWNVEGLTDLKLEEICKYMNSHSVDIMCMQEVRRLNTDKFFSEGGHEVLISGSGGGGREWAGVGFIISPKLRHFIMGFRPLSNRIAALKLRVDGGSMALLSVLAPHNLRPIPERIWFYDELEKAVQAVKVNGSTYVFGDLNARLGQRRHGEEAILGGYCFGREAQHVVEAPNRDLLIEFCTNFELAVANTWVHNPPHAQVTYHELSVPPMSRITIETFAVLDLLLCPAQSIHKVSAISSDRLGCIASHHFPVIALLDVCVDRKHMKKKREHRRWDLLQNADSSICKAFINAMGMVPADGVESGPTTVEDTWAGLKLKMNDAATKHIPKTKQQPKKPWVSDRTMQLIGRRSDARVASKWNLEKELRKETKRSARKDRAEWLRELAGKGDWSSIKKLRGHQKSVQTRLKDRDGIVVSTEQRSSTLADHLETVQWCVRPVTLLPDLPPNIFPDLTVEEGLFTHVELRKAISRLASGKATRQDDVPIECFKAIANAAGGALQQLLDLYNTCWASGSVPKDWLTARVAMIFKKGDPAESANYRPICLTAVAYRVYASMVKQRLLDAGLDSRLWPSQFGFRKGLSTVDALYVARRRIELACAQRDGQISLLALDWAKAFDSVHVGRLLFCLRRFGVKGVALNAIESLMQDRRFFVEDCGELSSLRPQLSGISQGCTLSPLLFVVVMSAVMHDAVAMLSPAAKAAHERGDLADLVYADDTLLLGSSTCFLEEFLRAVGTAGRTLGMELHDGKFQLLQIRCSGKLRNSRGQPIESTPSLAYLGASISDDGKIGSELARRIGAAKKDFRSLCKVWKHSSLTTRRKLDIFRSLVESRFMYGLCTAAFTKAEMRRIDGFQAKCLRTILGIQPSYWSRVSNEAVRQQARWKPASQLMLEQQLILLGKVMRSDGSSPMRTASFMPNSLSPATERYVRKVGRPRKEWITSVLPAAYRITGGDVDLLAATANASSWKHVVKS